MFKKLLNRTKQLQNKNAMEALVAAMVLISATDGTIEKEEEEKMQILLENSDLLKGFNPKELNGVLTKCIAVVRADFNLGKTKLMREIGDISGDVATSEEVLLSAIAIANADGEFEDKEVRVLEAISKTLGLRLQDYME